jgi:hypothetical protein
VAIRKLYHFSAFSTLPDQRIVPLIFVQIGYGKRHPKRLNYSTQDAFGIALIPLTHLKCLTASVDA